jgi:hypothetical protein
MTEVRRAAAREQQTREPDWDELRAIGVKMDGLIKRGEWTKAEFNRLLAAACEACNGYGEFTEFVLNMSELTSDREREDTEKLESTGGEIRT